MWTLADNTGRLQQADSAQSQADPVIVGLEDDSVTKNIVSADTAVLRRYNLVIICHRILYVYLRE